jgi:hypothetical protein
MKKLLLFFAAFAAGATLTSVPRAMHIVATGTSDWLCTLEELVGQTN